MKYAVMSQMHCTQPTMYKFFCLKIDIKNKADSYMPCEAMAHSTKSLSRNVGIFHLPRPCAGISGFVILALARLWSVFTGEVAMFQSLDAWNIFVVAYIRSIQEFILLAFWRYVFPLSFPLY